MKKEWRPDNWDETALSIIEELSRQGTVDLTRRALIETGADAMLEALKKGEGFRCSVIGANALRGGSTTEPMKFAIVAQSVVEDKDGSTFISLPNFDVIRGYPLKKGWLVFIPEEALNVHKKD